MPELPPDDEGTWRRISVVEFMSRFVDKPNPNNPNEFKRDRHLTEKLDLWKEAFMYILLEEYKTYKKTGLVEPEIVKHAADIYHSSSDSVGTFCKQFIMRTLIPDPLNITYVRLPDIEDRFKESEFYDSSIKKKDFKKMVIKSLCIDWLAQKSIKSENIKSLFIGVEWIKNLDDEKQIDAVLRDEK
jgi:phage/plasmid-associated DNA primase